MNVPLIFLNVYKHIRILYFKEKINVYFFEFLMKNHFQKNISRISFGI